MLRKLASSGLSEKEHNSLQILSMQYTDVFRAAFLAGPLEKVEPLRIDIAADEILARACLRMYFQ